MAARQYGGVKHGWLLGLMLLVGGAVQGATLAPTVITSPLFISAVLGDPYTYTLTSNGTAPLTFTTSALPPGLSLAGNIISGTPQQFGTFFVSVTAANPAGSASATLEITVNNISPGIATFTPPTQPIAFGGQGAQPVAQFVQNVGGGSTPTTVSFDPSATYAPAPAAGSGETYLFTVSWDFGDGSSISIGPSANPSDVLLVVSHSYMNDSDYAPAMTINFVIMDLNGSEVNGSGSVLIGNVLVNSSANTGPVAVLDNLSSPPNGALPYTLTLTPSGSYDPDGYIIWAQIDWGDGTMQLLNPAPPNLPQVPFSHTYTSPGTFSATLSVIDNGRIPLGVATTNLPGAGNPQAALQTIRQLQLTTITPSPYLQPQMAQTSVTVTLTGNVAVKTGSLKVDFTKVGNDFLDVTLRLQQPLNAIGKPIILSVQNTVPLGVPLAGVTLSHNKFGSAAGLQINYTPVNGLLRVRMNHAALGSFLTISNRSGGTETLAAAGTRVNAALDIPLSLSVVGGADFGAVVHFVYNATAGASGKGKVVPSF